MNFAVTWGIQDSLAVRLRLFQLRQPQYGDETVSEQLDSILATLGGSLHTPVTIDEDKLELALDFVKEQEEIDGAVKALLFDDEMEALAQTCEDDGDWHPHNDTVRTRR